MNAKIRIQHLNFFYGARQVLHDITLDIAEKKVTALFGPSGCGKTTLLRTLNRMDLFVPGARAEGEIWMDGINLLSGEVDPVELRARVGMVFQRPNPFPRSIFENVAYGLKIQGIRSRSELEGRVEEALKRAALWEEVKDKLHHSAYDLSGGQQQRLCIARAIAVEPEVLLFDEPTSALDPVATARVEDLIRELSREMTCVIVTHNMQQAARVSDYSAFLYFGKLVEFGETGQVFTAPQEELTAQYLTGRFG